MKQAQPGARAVGIKRWLWRGWLPAGDVVIGEGMAGIGKSQFFLNVMASLSTGSNFLDGSPHPTGSPVPSILCTAEDAFDEVVAPRLVAATTDLNHVTLVDDLSLPSDLGDLEAMISRTGAGLVVIDPLFNHIEGINPNHDADIREQVMRPLGEIARERHCTIVVIRHFNKGSGVSVTMRGSGSYGGLTGAARAVITAVEEPHEDPGERTGRTIIGVTKSNYGSHPKPLVFTIEERCPARDPVLAAALNAGNTTPVVWPHDYTVTHVRSRGVSDMSVETAQMKLENRRAARGTETRRKPAVEALHALLDGMGKVPATQIYADMSEQGFGEKATQTARDALGVRYEKAGYAPQPWVWWLPEGKNALARSQPEEGVLGVLVPKDAPNGQERPAPTQERPATITIPVQEPQEPQELPSMLGGGTNHITPIIKTETGVEIRQKQDDGFVWPRTGEPWPH